MRARGAVDAAAVVLLDEAALVAVKDGLCARRQRAGRLLQVLPRRRRQVGRVAVRKAHGRRRSLLRRGERVVGRLLGRRGRPRGAADRVPAVDERLLWGVGCRGWVVVRLLQVWWNLKRKIKKHNLLLHIQGEEIAN